MTKQTEITDLYSIWKWIKNKALTEKIHVCPNDIETQSQYHGTWPLFTTEASD